MNNCVLMGRLVRDSELRHTQKNQAVARFTLAVDKFVNGEKQADFINIVCWGKLAENVVKFTEKGKRVIVLGRIQTGSYEDKDGKRVYTTDVVASNVEFIDWKDNQTQSNQGFNNFDDFDPISDDSRIPF